MHYGAWCASLTLVATSFTSSSLNFAIDVAVIVLFDGCTTPVDFYHHRCAVSFISSALVIL
ncbi:hypothetical protein RhiirA5_367317 [Rhizophagus irregularis]|uniref:Uncharacterized protein n=2 Tax=Rhizophagus irregularis TaxID=588596 RepID=A0A2I1FEM6_9GLOM|nr:hypothetical protein RhiirA5_367317 [Rhizophagus irregularis]PKY32816.1 hypothetical protein RhiirB3_420296 [Rhizophagus irregularis]